MAGILRHREGARTGRIDANNWRRNFRPHSKRLSLESLEARVALTVNVIESFPELFGDAGPGASLGASVAIDGDWAVAGAPYDLASGQAGGAAYLYRKVAGAWNFQTKLVGHDTAYNHGFGTSVSIDGDTIVVGARDESERGYRAGAAYVFQIQDGAWMQQAKLLSSDAGSEQYFGRAVDIDGDTIVVGAHPGYYASTSNSQSAYVFQRSGSAWSETAKLKAAPLPGDWDVAFGNSVAIAGDVILVGATEEDVAGVADAGVVYQFQRAGGGWAFGSKISAPDAKAGAAFGAAVAADGDRAVVGSPDYTLPMNRYRAGKAYVFAHNDSIWSPAATLIASDAGVDKQFGVSVDMHDGSVVIGSTLYRGYEGSAYLFQEGELGSWTEEDQIILNDTSRQSYPFGQAVAVYENDILVGEFYQNTFGQAVGAVHQYEISSAETEASFRSMTTVRDDIRVDYIVQDAIPDLTIRAYRSTDPAFDVGDLAHLADSTTFAAARGAASYTFDPGAYDGARPYLIAVVSTGLSEHRYDNNQISMLQRAPLYALEGLPPMTHGLGLEGASNFGGAIAIDGNRAVVSALNEQFNGGWAGAVFVFDKVDGLWIQQARLTPSNRQNDDGFGTSVAISGDTIVVGASRYDGLASDAGATFVYVLIEGEWVEQTMLTAPNLRSYNGFGYSVAIEGDTIVVGARGVYFPDSVQFAGSAYVFERTGSSWSPAARLPSSGATSRFGGAVDVSGNYIAVGDSGQGAVHLFALQGDSWVFRKLVTGELGANSGLPYARVTKFGSAIDLNGDQLAVTASSDDGSSRAYAFVFRIPSSGLVTLDARITLDTTSLDAPEPRAVAIDGNHLIIGDYADRERGYDAGAVYHFERVSPGAWIEHPEIVPLAADAGDRFGYAFATRDGELLIGAPNSAGGIGVNGVGLGSVHRFEFSQINADVQIHSMRHLTSRQIEVGYARQGSVDPFDFAVYRSADPLLDPADLSHRLTTHTVASTTSGLGVFTFDPGPLDTARPYLIAVASSSSRESSYSNNHAVLEQVPAVYAIQNAPELLSSPEEFTRQELLGYSIAIDGDLAVIGAPAYGSGAGTGAAYVWRKIEGRWRAQARLLGPVSEYDGFGQSVAIHGNTIIVGAPGPSGLNDDGGVVFVFEGAGSSWTLSQELVSSDSRINDGFGTTVAIEGDAIVVAAKADGYNSPDRLRAIYIFERNADYWSEVHKVHGANVYPDSYFGASLDISGDTIVVSAPFATSTPYENYGAAFVYSRVAGAWTQTASVVAPARFPTQGFASAVAVEGATMVIAARRDSHFPVGDGSVIAYVYSFQDGAWTYQQKIKAPGTSFGGVAIDGDSILMTANFDAQAGYGAPSGYGVYLFKRSASGLWLQHAKVSPDPLRNPTGDVTFSAAIDGDSLLVGTPGSDLPTRDAGAVWAYGLAEIPTDVSLLAIDQPAIDVVNVYYAAADLTAPARISVYRSADAVLDSVDLNHQVAAHVVPSGTSRSKFAFDPGERDLSRPYLIAAATAAEAEHSYANNVLIVNQLPSLGLEYEQTLPGIVDPTVDAGAGYGVAIDADGRFAVIGEYWNFAPAPNLGAVHVMELVEGQWLRRATLTAPPSAPNSGFGKSVAIRGNTIVVGAYLDDEAGVDAGAAYAYRNDGAAWVLETKLLGNNAYDFFGFSVDVEGSTAVVGAYGWDSYYNQGAAFVYERNNSVWQRVASLTYLPNLHYAYGNYSLGWTVAISGNYIAVGSQSETVAIARKVGEDWAYSQLAVRPKDATGAFGRTLVLSGGLLVIGSADEGSPGLSYAGSAYVYELDDGGHFKFSQELSGLPIKAGARFGTSLAIRNDFIVVSARDSDKPGAVSSTLYVFDRRGDGRWTGEAHVTSADLGLRDYLDGPMTFSGDVLMIGGFTGDVVGTVNQSIANRVQTVHLLRFSRPSRPSATADFDQDGAVDGADFLTWQRTFGLALTPHAAGDATGDGMVDGRDLVRWAADFGEPVAAVGPMQAVVSMGEIGHEEHAIGPRSLLAPPGTTGERPSTPSELWLEIDAVSSGRSNRSDRTLAFQPISIADPREDFDEPPEVDWSDEDLLAVDFDCKRRDAWIDSIDSAMMTYF